MAAMNYVADELVVLGGGGGRTDHLISNSQFSRHQNRKVEDPNAY
jgi:thiamine pyrophosphokinase